jgi:DNA-binding LytR/AlgR family response regulator
MELAVIDSNSRRAEILAETLELFASDNSEVGVLPYPPLQAHVQPYDIVFLSFDECGELTVQVARVVRSAGEEKYLLLVSERRCDISPCLRPSIRPSGVLFRPLQTARVREMLNEITIENERLSELEREDTFVIKSNGTSYRLPVEDILFFEAREKKIFVKLLGRELGFYGSIEQLSANLEAKIPGQFVRCHRSFLINVSKVKAVQSADMLITLADGSRLPVSRSYRDVLKLLKE